MKKRHKKAEVSRRVELTHDKIHWSMGGLGELTQ